MSDHDTYRKLMAETERAAPRTPVTRFVARALNRVSPERPASMFSAREHRQVLREIREFASDPTSQAWLRRRQTEVEAELVRTGEMSLSETTLLVRAGIENVQDRLAKSARPAQRRVLTRWMREGPHGSFESIRDKLRHVEEQRRADERARAEAEREAQRVREERAREEQRQLEEMRRAERNAEIDAWVREGLDRSLATPAERVRLLRGVRAFVENPQSQEWLSRRERAAERERRALLTMWMRRDPRTGRQHPVHRRNFWR